MGRIITTMLYAELARLLLTDDVDPERGPRLVIVDVDDVTRDVRLVWEHEDLYAHEDGVEPVVVPHVELIESFIAEPAPLRLGLTAFELDVIRAADPSSRRAFAEGLREGMTSDDVRKAFREFGRMAKAAYAGRCPAQGASPYVVVPEPLECGLPLSHDGPHVWEGIIDGESARSTWSGSVR